MKDRSVEFPNRYRLTKVAGTDDIYDLVPAPGDVTEEGTYINKATLLKDTTAALYGLDGNAVPDDVFSAIKPITSPTGTIAWFSSQTPPEGWLICDGSVVNIEDYPDLYNVIGSTFGTATETTFTLPNLLATFIRGAGSQNGYSATFGQKQEATTTGASAGLIRYGGPLYADKSVSETTTWGTSAGTGSYSSKNYFVRPYNIALTPIIKY